MQLTTDQVVALLRLVAELTEQRDTAWANYQRLNREWGELRASLDNVTTSLDDYASGMGRLAAYDAATTDPVTGPLARIAAAADRPADPDARDEIVQQIRAYRSQVIESADKIHAVAMRTLDQVMARLDGMTDQDVAKMSMRDLAALTNAALAAIKQAQECKGNFYGLTEFIAYLENVERESTDNPQVSHRSEDAKD